MPSRRKPQERAEEPSASDGKADAYISKLALMLQGGGTSWTVRGCLWS